MLRYRLHLEDGTDVGESTYAVPIHPGEEIFFGNGRRFRVVDVVPIEEEDSKVLFERGAKLFGLLRVEPA